MMIQRYEEIGGDEKILFVDETRHNGSFVIF
jgi:hypothetical protein